MCYLVRGDCWDSLWELVWRVQFGYDFPSISTAVGHVKVFNAFSSSSIFFSYIADWGESYRRSIVSWLKGSSLYKLVYSSYISLAWSWDEVYATFPSRSVNNLYPFIVLCSLFYCSFLLYFFTSSLFSGSVLSFGHRIRSRLCYFVVGAVLWRRKSALICVNYIGRFCSCSEVEISWCYLPYCSARSLRWSPMW